MSKKKMNGELVPEKARLLQQLQRGQFNVPDFIYVSAADFKTENFGALEDFLKRHRESFKVITRSAHPLESFYKSGTFDSLETYADISGILYARKKIINLANTAKRLSILRQQKFSGAPQIDPEELGVIVMPFINGTSVMAKILGDRWEFGYCRDRDHKVRREPYITNTPHDRKLMKLSGKIQKFLDFHCEIEYIISGSGEIFVVQAKDISHVETLEQKESELSVRLDGVRRVRIRRNYRERPIYVMDNRSFYLEVISRCEDIVLGDRDPKPSVQDIIQIITDYQREMETFATTHQRFCVLGLSIQEPEELYQIAAHYLDDFPEMQQQVSRALHNNLYQIDYFLSEADTLLTKDRFRVNLCSHDAYGIDTVRNPMWAVFWNMSRHDKVVQEFNRIGFKTGDTVGIDIDTKGTPTVFRI